MQPSCDPEPPVKRRRLSNDASEATTNFDIQQPQDTMDRPCNQGLDEDAESKKERKSGIIHNVHPKLAGFSGVLKQRQALLLCLRPTVSAETKQIYGLLGE